MAKVSYAGHSCFQISVSPSKDLSADLVIDPFSDSTGLKLPNLSADIALVTFPGDAHDNVKGLKGEPLILQGPGEYEARGVFIQGIDSEGSGGKNTIYTLDAEGIKFCHLGALSQAQLTDEQLEKIDTVDVLFVPVGGGFSLDASQAHKIVAQIDPKIVIPMRYQQPKLKEELDEVSKFLKAMGKNDVAPVDKLTLKAKELPKDGAMEIIILAA